MDAFDVLDIATAGFASTLRFVEPADLTRSTPNPGWTVRDLLNHVVGGNRRYVLLLTGAPTEEVEALRDLDHLTTDPYADFVATAAEVSTAFRGPGVLDRIVHHRWGDRTGLQLLFLRITEHALHGWDLARAIDADDSLDLSVADFLLAAIDVDPTLVNPNAFAIPPNDDGLTGAARLLALTGRG
ncbi:MAG TPA: TIGR03086 family metal-binding protein [Mycobacteriales bacterium]|nr:TIGR03086 family metal-binding protein [Mycobacteriales bacterium]